MSTKCYPLEQLPLRLAESGTGAVCVQDVCVPKAIAPEFCKRWVETCQASSDPKFDGCVIFVIDGEEVIFFWKGEFPC